MTDWLGYQIVMLIPLPRSLVRDSLHARLYLWALGHAGAWAYRDHDFGDASG
jgi:hypothetical protein